MWSSRGRSGVDGVVITVVAAFLSLLVASSSFAAAGEVAHSRTRRVAPKAAAPAVKRPATAAIPGREMLVRLQDGQRTLAKQAADFNAAIQRQINQLSNGIADSQRETQQMLEATGKRIDSTRRFLEVIVALLVLLCGGLLYVARHPPRLGDKSFARLEDKSSARPEDEPFAWKGDLKPGPDDEGTVSWETVSR